MPSKDWNINKIFEIRYRRLILSLTNSIFSDIINVESPQEIQNIINNYHFDNVALDTLVYKFLSSVEKENNKTWGQSLKNSITLHSLLTDQIENNSLGHVVRNLAQTQSMLIKSIPARLSKEVSNIVMEKTFQGIRAKDIAKELKDKIPTLTDNKAKLIARTQVSASQSALTQARSQSLGINWYIWRTSEDERVRHSHDHMENVLVSWNQPPSPEALVKQKSYGSYHAGNTFNCRCYAQPIVNINRVSFPAKVFWNGQIVRMSKEQFLEIM